MGKHMNIRSKRGNILHIKVFFNIKSSLSFPSVCQYLLLQPCNIVQKRDFALKPYTSIGRLGAKWIQKHNLNTSHHTDNQSTPIGVFIWLCPDPDTW